MINPYIPKLFLFETNYSIVMIVQLVCTIKNLIPKNKSAIEEHR
jgi:hypothetical protein